MMRLFVFCLPIETSDGDPRIRYGYLFCSLRWPARLEMNENDSSSQKLFLKVSFR